MAFKSLGVQSCAKHFVVVFVEAFVFVCVSNAHFFEAILCT